MTRPSVKPLEWIKADGHLDADICDTFGLYQISDGDVLFIGHSGDAVAHGSQEAAKAAAQADYEKRILSALVDSQMPTESNRELAALKLLHKTWDDLPQEERQAIQHTFMWTVQAAIDAGLVRWP